MAVNNGKRLAGEQALAARPAEAVIVQATETFREDQR